MLKTGSDRTNGASINTGTDTKNTAATNTSQFCRQDMNLGKDALLSSSSNVGLVAE